MLAEILAYNKSALCGSASPAFSMSLIRDPARGTSQLHLDVAWTSAFKQFFLLLLLSFSTRKHTSMGFHVILSNFFEKQ